MNPATSCVGNRRHSLPSCSRSPWAGCSENGHSRLVCRVLAPPEAPGRRPRSATVDVSQPPAPSGAQADFWSSTTSFASQLLSHFRVPAFAVASPDALLREASTKERELQNSKAPLDVSAFLSPVGVWELKHIRKLSSLTALTYLMHLVTPRRLLRTHGLELVTTSHACDIRPYEHNRTAEEVGADGDGMAISVHDAREVYQALKRDGGAAGLGLGLLTGSSNIVTLARELPYQVVPSAATDAPQAVPGGGGGPSWPVRPSLLLGGSPAAAGAGGGKSSQQQQPQQQGQQQSGSAAGSTTGLPRMLRTPAEVVAAKLAEAASAAASAASTAAAGSPLASAAENFYAGLASLPLRSGLVGANNWASNAMMAPPQASAPDGAATAPGGSGADGEGYGAGSGGRKATAAAIAAMATDQIRQQTIRGAVFGSLGRGSGGGGSSGMAAVSSNGLMSSAAAAPTAAASSSSSSSSSSSLSLTFAAPTTSLACPSEWFVVDDVAASTRVFVIQGSDTLDHWKLNLTFDPVPFEDSALGGIKVHRGVYEAALVLYDRFLPLVYEHLESSPFSKIAFTGHSIGGSLATLLMLMYRSRGVLQPHSIATVYTFGAPAVFCQSSNSHNHSDTGSVEDAPLATSDASPGSSSSGGTSAPSGCACGADLLLARLQLPPHIVRNVVMARDIVPRAFACDYSPVADILKGWGSSFKEHCCLNRHGRKHLYYFVGRMCILQADSWHSFTANDPDHPMLPPGPDLLAITDAAAQPAAAKPKPVAAAAKLVHHHHQYHHHHHSAARPAARSVTEAIWELMDCPHPLETLADPGAYMASGSISRYHNPEHYTKALARITHLKRQAERRSDHRPHPPPKAKEAAAARRRCDSGGGAAAADAATTAVAAVQWDSSDGLDLHLVAPAYPAADVHA